MTDSELDCIKRIGELKRERAELIAVLRQMLSDEKQYRTCSWRTLESAEDILAKADNRS